MEILYLLIPLAVLIAVVIVGALLWAVRSGQFEDLEGPAHRILMDDEWPPADADSPKSGDTPDESALDPSKRRR
jgi:cbb3-type cytochrome oxidase maturation protein